MTRGRDACSTITPREFESWASISLSGVFRKPQFSPGGLGLWLRIEVGTQAFGLLEGPVNHGLMDANGERFAESHDVDVVPLQAGNWM